MFLSTAAKKGGDIYIHGAQASAGCLAMSNYYIEDIYIYAVKAKNNGQQKFLCWFIRLSRVRKTWTTTPAYRNSARM